MSEWNYTREESTFELPPEGDYRIRIKSADKAQSSTGKDMLTLQFEVSGNTTIIYHNIVFMPDKPEITNRMLTQFFDAFPGIKEGNFNLNSWTGKVGAAKLKKESYNDKERLVVHYFLSKKRADELPAWVEPTNSTTKPRYEEFPDNGESPF